jgi:predicted AAA+ superfamily ATPase
MEKNMIERQLEKIIINRMFKGKVIIIMGARQVGKTTLVRMFTEMENIKIIEINCEKPWSFEPLFNDLDPVKIIEAIEFELNISINPETSLIFFDEVQNIPSVLKMLRYFYEEAPEYKVIATGSSAVIEISGRVLYNQFAPLYADGFFAM